MLALITGATSGIGMACADYLIKKGWNLIVTGRNKDALFELKHKYGDRVTTIACDLSDEKQVFALYDMFSAKSVDMLINNAGFGIFGEFTKSSLNDDINMINVNIKAVHILMKLFLKDFEKRGSGYILNVASSAGFMPGPLMAEYYASKSYVVELSVAVNEELRRKKSGVSVSVLCPGPVNTNFNDRAGVEFSVKPLSPEFVAKYAIDNTLKKKTLIVPGNGMKTALFFEKFLPKKQIAKVTYEIQKKKLY